MKNEKRCGGCGVRKRGRGERGREGGRGGKSKVKQKLHREMNDKEPVKGVLQHVCVGVSVVRACVQMQLCARVWLCARVRLCAC